MKTLFLLSLLTSLIFAEKAPEKAPEKVYELAKNEISSLGTNAIIIEAVESANAKNITLAKIKELDDKWKKTAGIDAFMKTIMENSCAEEILKFADANSFVSEIFVMDNQGANVAMSDKTSDYWQGDEAKFIKSYNKGAGEIFVDDVEFDKSSQTYSVQVSVPVMKDGKAIGAITVGVNVDKLK